MSEASPQKTNRWFRLYHELLRDRKIARAARMCNVERATVIGVWTGIMCLANESPERGSLFLAPNVPLTTDDLPEEIGINEDVCFALVDAFQQLDMLTIVDGIFSVTHFMNRQFDSECSTERTREYRERKRAETKVQEPESPPSQVDDSDSAGTSQERHGNVTVTAHSIADTEHSIADITAQNDAPNTPERQPTPHQAMFGALAEVCVVDKKLQKSRIGKVAKELREADYSAPDVLRWYSRGGWWYRHDWRGKQGQVPKLDQIIETIAQAKQDEPKARSPAERKRIKIINPLTNQVEDREMIA
jgi:hypothetical protein